MWAEPPSAILLATIAIEPSLSYGFTVSTSRCQTCDRGADSVKVAIAMMWVLVVRVTMHRT
jgi:hypothetical protein